MLTMSDGTSIHTVFLKPEGQPVAHIHLMHGMAEHIGRYEEFMKYLVGEGFAVSGHIHRGHGETVTLNGKLGYFGDTVGFDRLVEDAREIIRFFKDEFQTNNVILFGHSMGSFIARRFVQNFGLETKK